MPVRVKKESLPAEDADDGMLLDDNHNNTTNIDDDEEEEDEIVREMDVYLAPQLARYLHLLQFPLQQFPSQFPEQPLPLAVRFKPQHNMLELDQDIPTRYIEHQGEKYLKERTYASHTVPVTTHLALGKIVKDDNDDTMSLHLAPLHHITQMRPTFTHIDQDDPLNVTLEEEQALAASQNIQGDKQERKPLMFQKKESERAAMARKSSYAYKRSSEDGEEWLSLQVLGDDGDLDAEEEEAYGAELELLRQQIECPVESRGQSVLDVAATDDPDAAAMEGIRLDSDNDAIVSKSASLSLASYVRSLDYLPSATGTYDRGPITVSSQDANNNGDEAEDGRNSKFLVDWKQTGWDESAVLDLPAIVGHLTTLLCGGWPIPFSILRGSLPPSVSEKDILTALSACAVMVSGNFVIQSRLLQLPKSVTKARTFMMLLLQSMGIIHRSRLDRALGIKKTTTGVKKEEGHDDGDNDDGDIVPDDDLTDESILMLLEQMAQKTADGWILKVQEDAQFLVKFPENTELYMQYWGRQTLRFQDHLQRYAATVAAV